MSPFRLEVSDHAAERLSERRITRMIVRQCIASGKLIGVDIRGRCVRQLDHKNRRLVVIYIMINGGALLVTAYWED